MHILTVLVLIWKGIVVKCHYHSFKFVRLMMFNSLWPSDIIWWQGSRSTLAQVMACCLTVPSYYQNQCWLIISKDNFTRDTSTINHWNCLKIKYLKCYSNFPGANESMQQTLHFSWIMFMYLTKYSQWTSHKSSVRVRYSTPHVSSKSDLFSTSVVAMLWLIHYGLMMPYYMASELWVNIG